MKLNRDWITPLTIGSFILVAITGVLMFFHFDTGWNKQAHEWLSWIFLGAIALHIIANVKPFKKAFSTVKGLSLIGVFTLILAASFLPIRAGGGEPPFVAPIRALGNAPLSTVAEIAHVNREELRHRLQEAGVTMTSDRQSLKDLIGDDVKKQIRVLNAVFTHNR